MNLDEGVEATRRGDFAAVLRGVGEHSVERPTAEEEDVRLLLRANAFERQRQVGRAVEALLPAMLSSARRDRLATVRRSYGALGLCPNAFALAEERAEQLLSHVVSDSNPNLVIIVVLLIVGGAIAAVANGLSALSVSDAETRRLASLLAGVLVLAAIGTGVSLRGRAVMKRGIRGHALVLDVFETNRARNGRRDVCLVLLVELPGRAAYLANYHRMGMSDAQAPGNRVEIIVHPTNPKRMRLE